MSQNEIKLKKKNRNLNVVPLNEKYDYGTCDNQ